MPRPWPPLPDRLLTDENRDAVRFLATPGLSAHSDVAEVLALAIASCAGAQLFCPDSSAYAYLAAFRSDNRIFAIAYGMQVIAVRLVPIFVVKALADGASSAPNLGSDWVLLDAFASNAQSWIQRAYAG
jgi:hypothetical protein